MLSHLNIAGDGDEIDALEDIEREFGVTLDTQGAGAWSTVGDVFDALLLSLPSGLAEEPGTWGRFRRALCAVSGDDPDLVERETALIARRWSLAERIRSFFVR